MDAQRRQGERFATGVVGHGEEVEGVERGEREVARPSKGEGGRERMMAMEVDGGLWCLC